MPVSNTKGDNLAEELLLRNTWAPVTSTVSFIKASMEDAVRIWQEWEETRPSEIRTSVAMTRLTGSLEELLSSLLPLGFGHRTLFLETANPEWTAVVDNSARGQELSSALDVQFARKHGIRTAMIAEVPHTLDKKSYEQHQGRYGNRNLRIAGPGDVFRSVSLINNDKWDFQSIGDPFDFEHTATYEMPRKTDRFTHEMLVEYCRELGLAPFEEAFYAPYGSGIQVETHVNIAVPQLTLAEARAGRENRTIPKTRR
ncbi:hypothetical protein [Arthrobacter sp. ISL-95]|uniref:hypothetical protein n=1 Tax=Arthrobacter sp. ISL-95 TaxID=2819116 RepID=UPI001BE518BC|nr:hypothetical protein [Arthrobacter sp. ISL-95]MBT2586452.1 hypothetical protein [Arthrobacter sp. ISL-95]